MTEGELENFVAELRRLGPLFVKSGVADVFIAAADEIERLAAENKELQEHLDWLDEAALGKPG
jgi:hypothetical protein